MTAGSANGNIPEQWFEHKSMLMEASLGREHDLVLHAMFPYAQGGALDQYFYPHGLPGTAIATKELSEYPNRGPSNRRYHVYEMVMFTKHAFDRDAALDSETPFGRARANMAAILNAIGPYSAEATLNPGDTLEFPPDMGELGGRCLIVDGFACHSDEVVKDFGLLVVIEVFRSEMKHARWRRGARLIAKLKDRGYYPYSDMDREPVA